MIRKYTIDMAAAGPRSNWPIAILTRSIDRKVVELPGPPPGTVRLRRNVFDERMSTFEAVAQILGLLEGPAVEIALMDFYRRTIDRMMMLRGKMKASDIYGGLTRAPEGSPPTT